MAATFGTFEELLAITEPSMIGIATRLREIVLELDPDAVEVVRLGDRAATFGVGPKKMSEGYVYLIPYTHHVNLGFYRGSVLHDADGQLEGTGKTMRHVKIRSVEEAERPAIRRLIEQARAERRKTVLGESGPD